MICQVLIHQDGFSQAHDDYSLFTCVRGQSSAFVLVYVDYIIGIGNGNGNGPSAIQHRKQFLERHFYSSTTLVISNTTYLG